MADNTLARVESPGLSTVSEEQWSLIQRTFAAGATPDEFALFRSVAEREGLDPFTRQIHFVKRRAGDVSFVVGVHGLVGRLNRVPGFKGIQSAAVCQSDAFQCDPVNGSVVHTFGIKRGPVVGAWARGQIGDRMIVLRFVSMDEYRGQGPLWREKPATMIEKVAIAQCARALAPEELHGLYAAEEMGGATLNGGAVSMPSDKPTVAKADPDADAIALPLTMLQACTTAAELDTALPLLREAAADVPPSARRILASHVARRKVDLGWQEPPTCPECEKRPVVRGRLFCAHCEQPPQCPGCGDPVAPGKTTCANCNTEETES